MPEKTFDDLLKDGVFNDSMEFLDINTEAKIAEMKKFAERVTKHYNDFYWKLQYEYCQVCDEPLTPEEKRCNRSDFSLCCNLHATHRQDYNIDIVRKELGYKTRDEVDTSKFFFANS